MKKLSKLRLPLIERELSVLNEEELRAYIGGQKQSCVFNCFDTLMEVYTRQMITIIGQNKD